MSEPPYPPTGPQGPSGPVDPYGQPGQYPPGTVPPGQYQQGQYPAYPPAPPAGYSVPQWQHQPPAGYDPLISQTVGEWWQKSINLVRQAWRPLVTLQAIGMAATIATQAPVAIYTELTAANRGAADASDLGGLMASLGLTSLGSLLSVVVTALVTVGSIYVLMAVVAGLRPDLGPALHGAARRAFPLIGWQFLAGVIILAGVCACVLPAFYFAAVFTVLPAVVAFERGGAIGRCFTLFHRDLGAAAGRMACIVGFAIAAGLAGLGISAVVRLVVVGSQLGGTADTGAIVLSGLISTTIAAVISGGLAVLTAPLTLTAYADLRARTEPLATPVLLTQLGMPVPQAPPMPPMV